MGDRARDVHDERRIGRSRGRWGVLDDRDRLAVASVQAHRGQNGDRNGGDPEKDEDRSAHGRTLSDTSRRA